MADKICWKKTRTVLKKWSFKLSCDYDLKEEIIQESLVRAWFHYPKLNNKDLFIAWLSKIFRHTSFQFLIKSKTLESFICNISDSENEIFISHDSFQNKMKPKVLSMVINTAASDIQKSVAHLFYWEGKTVEDIAKKMHLRTNTVLSHLHRFRHHVEARKERIMAKIESIEI